MLAFATLAKLAIPVGLVALLAGSSDKKSGPQDMSGMLIVAPNGVVQVNPNSAAWVMQGLSQESATPVPQSPIGEAKLGPLGTPANAPNALLWAQGQAATGHVVLIGIEGNQSLASVPPGAEVQLAQQSQHKWAVLLEPPSPQAPLGIPGTPGLPGTPGAPGQPAAPGQPGFDPLGTLGQIIKPYLPQQPGTQPQPGQPGAPSSPSSPTQPAGWIPGTNGGPATVNIPGLGSFQVPTLPGQPGSQPAPGGDGPPLPSSTDPGLNLGLPGLTWPPGVPGIPGFPVPGQTPSGPNDVAPPGLALWQGTDGQWRQLIRNGDIASRLAQWYTGNFARWTELAQTNPNLRIVTAAEAHATNLPPGTPSSAPYGFTPWRLGQVLVLPPGWNGAKGIAPLTQSAGVGVAVGAY